MAILLLRAKLTISLVLKLSNDKTQVHTMLETQTQMQSISTTELQSYSSAANRYMYQFYQLLNLHQYEGKITKTYNYAYLVTAEIQADVSSSKIDIRSKLINPYLVNASVYYIIILQPQAPVCIQTHAQFYSQGILLARQSYSEFTTRL